MNVPRILAIIATICESNALEHDDQVLMRLLSIARHIQVHCIHNPYIVYTCTTHAYTCINYNMLYITVYTCTLIKITYKNLRIF